jgi:hypothetical protein
MFDLPVPWVTKAARALFQETESLFTPAGLPEVPPVVFQPPAPAELTPAAPDPSFLFQAPPKTPRKSRAKPKPVDLKPEPVDAEAGVGSGSEAASEPAGDV